MRDSKLKRLDTIVDLLEIATELLPDMPCKSLATCKQCDPHCRAANAVRSATLLIEEVAVMIEKEKDMQPRITTSEPLTPQEVYLRPELFTKDEHND